MRPIAWGPVLMWWEKILQGMRRSTNKTITQPQIPFLNDLLDRRRRSVWIIKTNVKVHCMKVSESYFKIVIFLSVNL